MLVPRAVSRNRGESSRLKQHPPPTKAPWPKNWNHGETHVVAPRTLRVLTLPWLILDHFKPCGSSEKNKPRNFSFALGKGPWDPRSATGRNTASEGFAFWQNKTSSTHSSKDRIPRETLMGRWIPGRSRAPLGPPKLNVGSPACGARSSAPDGSA